ncbi:unnamed protein product [Acanthoscelides obtectus]|uniref:Uncharacterized protein n=1 Tax=Acanthoscelides obtectus TaxID=200917 RepID=A0A9P0P3F1_ACAOB|nr:unnamed protein product [Acanthoscelides obtectus]CAK1655329.1 hypothetical protein AOBTE_LOCUS19142 [Acanthoscelides obtectus]
MITTKSSKLLPSLSLTQVPVTPTFLENSSNLLHLQTLPSLSFMAILLLELERDTMLKHLQLQTPSTWRLNISYLLNQPNIHTMLRHPFLTVTVFLLNRNQVTCTKT